MGPRHGRAPALGRPLGPPAPLRARERLLRGPLAAGGRAVGWEGALPARTPIREGRGRGRAPGPGRTMHVAGGGETPGSVCVTLHFLLGVTSA